MTRVQKLKLLVIVLFGLPLIICGQGQPVLVKNPNSSPVPVAILSGAGGTNSVAVTNAAGNVLNVREQRDVTTNAVLGGSIGITNYPSVYPVTGNVTVSGITNYSQVGVTGTVAVTQSTSPWVVSGTVNSTGTVAATQSTSPWVVSGQVGVTGTATVAGTVTANQGGAPWATTGSVTEASCAAILASAQDLTNGWSAGYAVTTSGSVYSNSLKITGGRLGGLWIGNTNASVVLYAKAYNITNWTTAVSAQTPIWGGIVPCTATGAGNNLLAGFPGGLAFSSGIAISITASPATNDATAVTGVIPVAWAIK